MLRDGQIVKYHSIWSALPAVTVFPSITSDTIITIDTVNVNGTGGFIGKFIIENDDPAITRTATIVTDQPLTTMQVTDTASGSEIPNDQFNYYPLGQGPWWWITPSSVPEMIDAIWTDILPGETLAYDLDMSDFIDELNYVGCDGATWNPTFDPTTDPTIDPTTIPTIQPTFNPTTEPTNDPTSVPTVEPTIDLTPINDFICDAIDITASAPINEFIAAATTTYATFDSVDSCDTTNTAPGVWYRLTIPNGNHGTVSYDIVVDSHSYDTKISVYEANSCLGPLSCIAGNDDFPGIPGFGSRVKFEGKYDEVYILLHGFGTATGTTNLNITSSEVSTCDPTTDPTTEPTIEPTDNPSSDPTQEPTANPTLVPTIDPTMQPTTARPSTSPTTDSGCTLTAYTIADELQVVFRDDISEEHVVNFNDVPGAQVVTEFPSIKSDTIIPIIVVNDDDLGGFIGKFVISNDNPSIDRTQTIVTNQPLTSMRVIVYPFGEVPNDQLTHYELGELFPELNEETRPDMVGATWTEVPEDLVVVFLLDMSQFIEEFNNVGCDGATFDPTSDPTTEPTIEPTTDPTADPTLDPTTDPTIDPTTDPTAKPSISPTINTGCTLTAYTMADDITYLYRTTNGYEAWDETFVNYNTAWWSQDVTVFPSIQSDTIISIEVQNGGGWGGFIGRFVLSNDDPEIDVTATIVTDRPLTTLQVQSYPDFVDIDNDTLIYYELGERWTGLNADSRPGLVGATWTDVPSYTTRIYFLDMSQFAEEFDNVCLATLDPTMDPTTDPTVDPTSDPTTDPTVDPTIDPTMDPTIDPTADPTRDPTADPTRDPTTDPTTDPTSDPTYDPTSDPTKDPTTDPTADPTRDPTADPTIDPTNDPTSDPTNDPTVDPTTDPTRDPTSDPTSDPTKDPTTDPTKDPTPAPTTPGISSIFNSKSGQFSYCDF